jgi:hypothetical protein
MSKSAATQVLYSERVYPKWSSFLPLALILPTFWLTFAPINPDLGLVLGLLVTLVVTSLMLANSPRIVVSASRLQVGKASIEVGFISEAVEIAYAPRFGQRIPNLDAKAYLVLQNSVRGLVKIGISDSKDPTPYWVVSTRNPQLLIEVIGQLKSAI